MKKTEPVLIVQQAFRLLGRPVIPGQTITDEEFSRVPPKNQEALLSQGYVTRDGTTRAPRDLTPAEQEASVVLKKAREKESAAAIRLHELHERNNALEKQIASLREKKGNLLADENALDYEDEIKVLRGQVNELEAEKSDVLEGLHAAIQRVGKADRAREAAEKALTLASVDYLIEEHAELCEKIQRKIEKGLNPLILRYRNQSLAFARALGEPMQRQLMSDWRLRRLLAPVLGDSIAPKNRIASLKDLETKLWKDTARFARQREDAKASKDEKRN